METQPAIFNQRGRASNRGGARGRGAAARGFNNNRAIPPPQAPVQLPVVVNAGTRLPVVGRGQVVAAAGWAVRQPTMGGFLLRQPAPAARGQAAPRNAGGVLANTRHGCTVGWSVEIFFDRTEQGN